MSSETSLRFDVPSAEALGRLVDTSLPLGLKAGPPARSFHRDIYLDTPDAVLQRRGMMCRFRIGMDDRRALRVTLRAAVAGGSLVAWEQFEAVVPDVEALAALQGSSEPARRLRGVLDPRRLGVRVELQTERMTRTVRSHWLPLKIFEFAYDTVSVHSGSLSRTFYELRIRRVGPGGPSLSELAEAVRREYGIRATPSRRIERAEELLSAMESEAPISVPTLIPEVTVIAVAEGRVVLRLVGGALALPVREGRGEKAAGQLLRDTLGDEGPSLELVGTVAASPSASAMEVWLARCADGDPAHLEAAGHAWVPFIDAMALAGSPALHDGRTLAALSMLAQGEAFEELCGVPASEKRAAPSLSRDDIRRALLAADSSSQSAPASQQVLNSEISLLEFNARLIDLAEDPSVPLLARLRFLSIFGSNTDEFFMVRVGSLRRALAQGRNELSEDGLGVHAQLDAISIRLRQILARQHRCFEDRLLPALGAQGIRLVRWADLDPDARAYLTRYYDEQVFPLLTPHAVTRAPGHPFPHIENLRLSLAAMVRDLETGRLRFGVTTLPAGVPRFVSLPDGLRLVPLEDVVGANLAGLYPGRRVEAVHCFRVTRIGDLELDEETAEDLLDAIEEEVKRRPFAGVVRLEVERTMPPVMRDLLLRELQMVGGGRGTTPGASGIFEVDGLLDLSASMEIASLDRPELDYPPFSSASPIPTDRPIFDVLRQRDVLVHHPYDAFDTTVQRLFTEAARDPQVMAIKATLYRVGRRAPIVDALLEAVEAGKEVDALVELKARFDEERNIEWVKKLEAAGVHVVYGLVNLKTHSKMAMVVRKEDGAVRRYVHVGTGNYNAGTARLYTDLGLLSSDENLAADVNDLFNQLMGSSRPAGTGFRHLLVAPTTMLGSFKTLIDREADHARAGREAQIRVTLNRLAGTVVIRALYRASQAGVRIDLVVRGLCTLRPGVPGLSERIRVVSVMGRFLEHSRVYHFRNDGADEYYIGSADWRPRNLRRRVEVVAPVTDRQARERLDAILSTELSDPTAWELFPDGSYVRRTGSGARMPAAQDVFLERIPRGKQAAGRAR